MKQPLITAPALKLVIDDLSVIVLDASRKPNFKDSIPSSKHFDIKNVFSATNNPLPNSVPCESSFQDECRKLGINQDSKIVVFDNEGVFTSPRVWWMFKAFGHEDVSILDGGLPEWKYHDYPTTAVARASERGDFKASFDSSLIKIYDQITANVIAQEFTVIDARAAGRFLGTSPEPRLHLQSGSIENSINLPYTEVLENGKYKSIPVLRELFESLNLHKKPVAFTCGSGITACIVLVAFTLIFPNNYSVYDGSWTEWAERNRLFVK